MRNPNKIPNRFRKALYRNGFTTFCAGSNPSFCANEGSPEIQGFPGFPLAYQRFAAFPLYYFVTACGYIAELSGANKQVKSLTKSLTKSRGICPGILS